MIFKLSLPKEPDEVWAITVDVSARLAPGEGVVLVEGTAYEVLAEEVRLTKRFSPGSVQRLGLSIVYSDKSTETTLMSLDRIEEVSLVSPRATGLRDDTIWVPERLMISPDRKKVQVVLQRGVSGRTYELDLNVHTLQFDAQGQEILGTDQVHKLRLQWEVKE